MSRESSIQEEKKLSSKRPELSELCRILQNIFLFLDFFVLILSITLVLYLIFSNITNFPYPKTIPLSEQMKLFCFASLLFTFSSFCGGVREALQESPCYPDETVLFQRTLISSLVCGLPLFFLSVLRLTLNFQTYASFFLIILFYILICLGIQSALTLLSDKYLYQAILFLRNQSIVPDDPYFGSEEIKKINEDLFSSYEMYLRQHQKDQFTSPCVEGNSNHFTEESSVTSDLCRSGRKSETSPQNINDRHINDGDYHDLVHSPINVNTNSVDNHCSKTKNSSEEDICSNNSASSSSVTSDSKVMQTIINSEISSPNINESTAEEIDEKDEDEEYANENIFQQQNWIFEEKEGTRIEGWINVFKKNDSACQRTIHLSFCPPFPQKPDFHLEQISGEPVQLTATRIFPFGVRFEVKRLHIDETEPTRFCYFASLK